MQFVAPSPQLPIGVASSACVGTALVEPPLPPDSLEPLAGHGLIDLPLLLDPVSIPIDARPPH